MPAREAVGTRRDREIGRRTRRANSDDSAILGSADGCSMKSACAALLLSVLALSACAHESNRDIASIWIIGKACQNCSGGLLIRSSGSIEDVDSQPPLTISEPRAVGDMLSSFPVDELHSAARHMPTLLGPANVVVLTVTYRDGRQERAPVPLGQLYNEIAKLQRWVEVMPFQATNAVKPNSGRAIQAALLQHTMRSITQEMLGCYGWCPSYSVTFWSNGLATIHDHGPRCDLRARANVPFDRVLQAALYAGASRIRPYYPIKAVDSLAARITFVDEQGTYVSNGPDRNSWGPEFLATQSRLDQIVRDVRWTPHINLEACAGRPNSRP